MSEVLVEFEAILTAGDGTRWVPRACGRLGEDGLWEGWIEFLDMADVEGAVRTPRETEQPNRDDLMYWAQGLTQAYLEGALVRARTSRGQPREREVGVPPHFDGPARTHHAGHRVSPRPILDPFSVFQQGEDVLVQELGALSTGRLRDLVISYGFATPDDAYGSSRDQLTSAIIAGVRRPLAPPPQTSTDASPEC